MPTMPYAPLPIDQDDVAYAYGPESSSRAGVAPGDVIELTLEHSIAYPGTTRRIWIHTAPGHDRSTEAAVMLFNDGWWHLDPDGDVRGGIVQDNLAAAGSIPPTVSVFVDPGMLHTPDGEVKNRNIEYDAGDSRYADFLVEEVLPLVNAHFRLSADSRDRGICGGSSGGNGAFTAAWQRPDAFGKVVAFNASFSQMPGGNPYPRMLAAGASRPLRAFLHAAHRDIGWDQQEHNWFAENLETAAALARAGQDVRLVVGDGGHSPNHGGVLLPDALRWLWRRENQPT